MERYHFVTNWVLDVPVESVWEKILDVEAYPGLWEADLTNPLLNLLSHVPFIQRMMEKSHNRVMTIAHGILRSSLEGRTGLASDANPVR